MLYKKINEIMQDTLQEIRKNSFEKVLNDLTVILDNINSSVPPTKNTKTNKPN